MQCRVCKKEITLAQLSDEDGTPKEAVYHSSFGVACLHHHGVAEHYDALIEEANANWEYTPYS
jgi:hypothetical protein